MRAPRFRLVRLAAAVAIAVLALAACGPSSPPAVAGLASGAASRRPEASSCRAGCSRPSGASAGVVLAHMQPADQSSWFDYAETLADDGYRTLTFNFRGYCPGGDAGCSSGETDLALLWRDVQAAVRYLRSTGIASRRGDRRQHGRHRGPRGRGAARRPASAPWPPCRPRSRSAGSPRSPETLVAATVGEALRRGQRRRHGRRRRADACTTSACRPSGSRSCPRDDHGTELLEGNQGPNVRRLLSVVARAVPARAGARPRGVVTGVAAAVRTDASGATRSSATGSRWGADPDWRGRGADRRHRPRSRAAPRRPRRSARRAR